MNERWIPIGEVAKRLSLSWPTTNKRLKAGDIPGLVERYGNRRVEREVFEKWLGEYTERPREVKRGPLYNEKDLVYFLEQGNEERPVKIGFSSAGCFEQRLVSIKRSSPYTIKILGTVHGSKHDERAFHRRFRADRLNGEWFRPSEKLHKCLKKLGF